MSVSVQRCGQQPTRLRHAVLLFYFAISYWHIVLSIISYAYFHLDTFFHKVIVQIACLLFNCVACFLIIEFPEFFFYFLRDNLQTIKFTLLVYKTVIFSVFTNWCNHSYCLISEHLHHFNKTPKSLGVTLYSPFSSFWKSPIYFPSLQICLF